MPIMRLMDYEGIKREWAKRQAKIAKLARNGMSQVEIARRFKISRSRVSRIVKNGQNGKAV